MNMDSNKHEGTRYSAESGAPSAVISASPAVIVHASVADTAFPSRGISIKLYLTSTETSLLSGRFLSL